MAPYQQRSVYPCSLSFLKLPVYTRGRISAYQPRYQRRSDRTHKASRATLNNPSNGADAKEHRQAQFEGTETYASTGDDQSALQSVSKPGAKVSDRLRAAVKQVDKQVHEVTAVPVQQSVALAPQKHEHPGMDTCTSLFSDFC